MANETTRPNPHDLEMVERARRHVKDCAGRMLSGKLSYLEGARVIWHEYAYCAVPEPDPDFDAFSAIISETDHLPVGPERQNWSEEALRRLRTEVEAAEEWSRRFGTVAASHLAKRFEGA